MSHYIHDLNPVIFSIGSISVYWYGLMYVIGIMLGWQLLTQRCKAYHAGRYHGWNTAFTQKQIDDLIFVGAISLMVGGRLGSFIFYYPEQLLENPLRVLNVQEGGMSFHGGLLGSIIGLGIYVVWNKIPWRDVADLGVSIAPLGLFFGRIGNFINGELWGKTTEVPWGIIFANTGGGPLPRHPSMLYEAALEGLVLFLVLWLMTRKPYRRGAPFGWFLLLYGIFRFAVEFVRIPDAHLGYLAWGWLTQGQRLSIPMIIIGLVMIVIAKKVAIPHQSARLADQANSQNGDNVA